MEGGDWKGGDWKGGDWKDGRDAAISGQEVREEMILFSF